MSTENDESDLTCWERGDRPYEPPTGRQAAPVVQWCGTAHHSGFTDGESEACEEMYKISEYCKFFVAGNEVAPTTGSKHYQFYAHFKKPIRFTALKKQFHGSICWFQCRGSPQANFNYCTKDDKGAIIVGEMPPDNGKREKERYQQAKIAAMEGRLEDIDADILIRHYGNVKRIREDYAPEPEEMDKVCGIWIRGEAGFGKSHLARRCFPELGKVFNKLINKWWDHYRGERVVLLDEFREPHTYLLDNVCRWADRYPFPAEVKGGVRNFRPKVVIITSQFRIEDLWNTHNDVSAMRRRFEVWNMDEKYKVTSKEPRWPDGSSGAPAATVHTFVTGIPANVEPPVNSTPARSETPCPGAPFKALKLERQMTVGPHRAAPHWLTLAGKHEESESEEEESGTDEEEEEEVIDLTKDD